MARKCALGVRNSKSEAGEMRKPSYLKVVVGGLTVTTSVVVFMCVRAGFVNLWKEAFVSIGRSLDDE